jgi:ketosteroid isomerase-like protein
MSNLATVQQIYAAFGQGDVPAILARLAENVEWEHDAADHGIPWLRPGRGKGHVLEFFGVVGKDLDITRFEVPNLLEGGSQVVAVIHIEATVRATGKSFKDLELHVWTFGSDGKAVRFRHVVDTHQHFLASRA